MNIFNKIFKGTAEEVALEDIENSQRKVFNAIPLDNDEFHRFLLEARKAHSLQRTMQGPDVYNRTPPEDILADFLATPLPPQQIYLILKYKTAQCFLPLFHFLKSFKIRLVHPAAEDKNALAQKVLEYLQMRQEKAISEIGHDDDDDDEERANNFVSQQVMEIEDEEKGVDKNEEEKQQEEEVEEERKEREGESEISNEGILESQEIIEGVRIRKYTSVKKKLMLTMEKHKCTVNKAREILTNHFTPESLANCYKIHHVELHLWQDKVIPSPKISIRKTLKRIKKTKQKK